MNSPDLNSMFSTTCEVSCTQPAGAFSHPPEVKQQLILAQSKLERLDAQNHAYEGAAGDRVNGGMWPISRQSTDSDLELDFDELRQRSRFIARNDSAGGMIDQRKDLTVGTGFTYLPMIEPVKGYITETQADQYNDELMELSESVFYRIGVTGTQSLWNQSRLIEGHHGFDGESVTILSDLMPDDDKPIPFVTEVIDPMRMDTPPKKAGDPNCRMGVQYEDSGRISGYWIQKRHPGETRDIDFDFEFYERRRVLHVFEPFFARQSRGLPWLVRNLNRLVDRKDLDQAGIVFAQIRACLMGFLESVNAPGMDNTGDLQRWANDPKYLEQFVKTFVPGMITALPPNKKITFSEPPTGSDFTESLNRTNDHRIAVGMNEPYESVSRDWSQKSFAGGRIILSGLKNTVEVRQELQTEKWFTPIGNRMVDEAVLLGKCSIPPRLYEKRRMIFQRHVWLPPVWPFSVNPGEEIKALLTAVDGNLMTKAVAVARFTGGSWKRIKAIRAKEREDERQLNIVPPLNAPGDTPVVDNQGGNKDE